MQKIVKVEKISRCKHEKVYKQLKINTKKVYRKGK